MISVVAADYVALYAALRIPLGPFSVAFGQALGALSVALGFTSCAFGVAASPLRITPGAFCIAFSPFHSALGFFHGALDFAFDLFVVDFNIIAVARNHPDTAAIAAFEHANVGSVDMSAKGAVIGIIELAIVIGVELGEDTFEPGRSFGARDPTIFVGVDFDIAMTAAHDDVPAAGLRAGGGDGESRKGDAQGHRQFHDYSPLKPGWADLMGRTMGLLRFPSTSALKHWRNTAPVSLHLLG
jgi:hypothetical protein